MAKIRVYPHNDLLSLAHYHRRMIIDKTESGNADAIALDCMSCLIALAFGVEALVNFVGFRKITGWIERRSFRHKIKQVCTVAGIEFDENEEPFLTVWQLKITRDSMAHGQPYEGTQNVSTMEELKAAMECPWYKNLNPDYINHACAQVKQFKHLLFDNCGISIGHTLTSGAGFIG